ncbi:MAG: hypothetical protein P1U46_01960, partial [Patescibacteria group bacterium]|nr:hypothetical protein [Patescibacteria group bacterium]
FVGSIEFKLSSLKIFLFLIKSTLIFISFASFRFNGLNLESSDIAFIVFSIISVAIFSFNSTIFQADHLTSHL